jgi:hypothetical protein
MQKEGAIIVEVDDPALNAAKLRRCLSSILFSGHSAWSQAARTIKVVVAVPPA